MAFSYGFFDSQNGDRRYNALEMSSIFDGIITDGVLPKFLDEMRVVSASGMGVIVKSGRAWFDHTWNFNSANLLLYINEADRVLTRYDAVVLEVNRDRDVRANTIKLITGRASTSPTKPNLTNTEYVKQYPLAYIRIDPKMTSVSNDKIEDMVGTELTPMATSKLQTTDISQIFNQWNGEFEDWYNGIKDLISDTNLAAMQAQINLKLDKSEKATVNTPVTDNTKYLTPATGIAMVSNQVSTIGSIVMNSRAPFITGEWYRCSKDVVTIAGYLELFNVMGHMFGARSDFFKDSELVASKAGGEYSFTHTVKPRSTSNIIEGAVTWNQYEAGGSTKTGTMAITADVTAKTYNAQAPVDGPPISYYPIQQLTYILDSLIMVGTAGIKVQNGNSGTLWQDPLVTYANRYPSAIVATVDDDFKFIVCSGVTKSDRKSALRVLSFSKQTNSNYVDLNIASSYVISIPGVFGGAWVFNKQIYYISDNTLYVTSYGSTNSIVYNGPSPDTIKRFCRNYWNTCMRMSYYNASSPQPNSYQLNENLAANYFSLDNKICVAWYATPHIDSNNLISGFSSQLYLDIAILLNEYTGAIGHYTKRISFAPFSYRYRDVNDWNYFYLKDVRPVIYRNANGQLTIGVIAIANITREHNGYGAYTKDFVFFGAMSGEDIKDPNKYMYMDVIFEDSQWWSFYFNDVSESTLYEKTLGANCGTICETLSPYATLITVWWRNSRRGTDYWSPFVAYVDLSTFRMPWLNNTSASNVFYIRAK